MLKRIAAALLVSLALAEMLIGPAYAVCSGVSSKAPLLCRDDSKLLASQHPDHYLAMPLVTHTVTGHGTATLQSSDFGILYPHGWPVDANGARRVSLAYDSGSRRVTITALSGGTFDVWVKGVKTTVASPFLSEAHAATEGPWYFDRTASGWAWSQTLWDLYSVAPTAYVYWSSVASDGAGFQELHGWNRDIGWHLNHHLVEGTELISGGVLGGYTLDTDTDAALRLSISECTIADEDIFLVNAAKDALDEVYTIWRRSGTSGYWTYSIANQFPFLYGTYPQRNYDAGGGTGWAMADISGLGLGSYVTAYVVATPAIDAYNHRFIIIPGQTQYSTLTAAQAESPTSLALGTLPFAEFTAIAQLVFKARSTYGGTAKAQLSSVTRLTGPRGSFSSTAAPTSHNSLGGLQGGAAGAYYHLATPEFVTAGAGIALGTGTTTATATSTASATATATGSGTATQSGANGYTGTWANTGTGTGTLTSWVGGYNNWKHTGTWTATSTVTSSRTVEATSTYSNTVTRTVTVEHAGTETYTATGALTLTNTVTTTGSATVTGTSGATAVGTYSKTQTETATGTTSLSETYGFASTKTITATGTATGSRTILMTATTTGTGTATRTISSANSTTGTVTGTSTDTYSYAPLTAGATLTLSGTSTGVASGVVTDTSTNTATATATSCNASSVYGCQIINTIGESTLAGSGTANYYSRWADSSTLETGMISDDGTTVTTWGDGDVMNDLAVGGNVSASNITATPTANAIPKANASGTLNSWVTGRGQAVYATTSSGSIVANPTAVTVATISVGSGNAGALFVWGAAKIIPTLGGGSCNLWIEVDSTTYGATLGFQASDNGYWQSLSPVAVVPSASSSAHTVTLRLGATEGQTCTIASGDGYIMAQSMGSP